MMTQPQSRQAACGAKLVIMEGDSVSVFSLEERPEWMVGRAESASVPGVIPLHSPIVSRYHGKLIKSGGIWSYLDNPGNTNGTLINGSLIPRNGGIPVRLYDGDVLRIDKAAGTDSLRNAVLMLFTTASAEGTWERCSIRGKQVRTYRKKPGMRHCPAAALSLSQTCGDSDPQ